MWRLRRVKDGVIIRKDEADKWKLVNGCRKSNGGRYTKKEAAQIESGSVVYKMMGITKMVDVSSVRINGQDNEGHHGAMMVKAYAEQAVPYYLEEYDA